MENRTIFCAREQAETEHTVVADGNNEFVVTCTSCGRFLKFPIGSELDQQIERHNESNGGQVVLKAYEVAEIVTKDPADMNDYELGVLRSSQDLLSDDEKESLGDLLIDPVDAEGSDEKEEQPEA